MARVILTGGTGLIGSALQQSLRARGATPVLLVRRAVQAGEDAVSWDPRHPDAAVGDTRPLEGAEYAVHLAGANLSAHRWTAAYKKTIVDSRVDASQALLNTLARLEHPPRVLVCASAIGIYGNRGNEILTEDSAPGTGYLPDVCKAWEAVPDAARALNMRVVRLRFGVVLSPEGGALKELLPVFALGLGGKLGDGRQWVSWVTLPDVVRAIEFALAVDDISGAYNTVAPYPVTNREFTAALAGALRRPAFWTIPVFALKLAFGQMAEDTLLASSRVLPSRLQAAGFQFESPEIRSALEALLRGSPLLR